MKIVYLLGKSASGKDTVYHVLKEDETLGLQKIVIYTTRPMRDGEKQGEQYHFISMEQAKELEEEGKVIESRTYQSVYGPWIYMTVNDGQFAADGRYLMIGTLESYNKMKAYFGEECMIPVYLEVDEGLRLERAMARERTQKVPKYAEMCRRFLADEADFTEEKLQEAGIGVRFDNGNLETCLEEIRRYLGGK
ncbi:MAG: guanylate kinase [Lachnospiraceae bacterium]|nr:guanylate kinase [Lachnospiraceae bacterium]